MKKLVYKKSFWNSLLSVIVLAVFAYIAMATFGGISQQKYKLPDGRWEISKHYSDGNTETTTGNVDSEGRWDGPVKIEYEDDNYMLTHTEEVNMVEGKRHGISKVIYPSGYVATYCYQHGERVDDANCEKSAIIETEDFSAYGILSYEVPWFVFKLSALGYDTNYVEAYMDTIETLLYATEFYPEDFEEYYSDVIDELEETAYDSILVLNAELSIYNGLDLILNHEFRLATLNSYRDNDSNTYNVVKTIYPNYLLTLNEAEVTDDDFKGFCAEYDKIMSGYDPMALDDPFLVDSLDERMYRAIDSIYSGDAGSAVVAKALKSAVLSDEFRTLQTFKEDFFSQIRNQPLDKTPKDVAEIVLLSILEKFIYGDLIKNAVTEAYSINNGLMSLPTVVTNFPNNISSTSVTLNGNVISDGGGEIQSRGIVWGTGYNPTINDQIVYVGSGTGDFEANITGLTEGETYYARTFAMNSAGFAYGNCITFVASSTTGILPEVTNTGFEIYPNPARDYIIINMEPKHSKRVIFTLFDVHGKVVFQKELKDVIQGETSVHLDLQNVQSGIYSCRITGDDDIYLTQKLMVNH